VVSSEFATGNGLTSFTAPIILNYCPAGANLASTGEVILWGCVCDPMSLSRRWRSNSGSGCDSEETTPRRRPPGIVRNCSVVLQRSSHRAQK
jgi:hypothetical protein